MKLYSSLKYTEHLKKLKNLLDLQKSRVEEIFDDMNKLAKENTVTIKGIKYIRVSPFRFSLKHRRLKALKTINEVLDKWINLEKHLEENKDE